MAEKPLWRVLFDSIEQPIREKSEAFVATKEFSKAAIALQKNRAAMNDKTRHALMKLLHSMNIPTQSDINKLSRQIGTLTNKVESLQASIDDLSRGSMGDKVKATPKKTTTRPKRNTNTSGQTPGKS